MDHPWIIHGLSMDYLWITHGLSIEYPAVLCPRVHFLISRASLARPFFLLQHFLNQWFQCILQIRLRKSIRDLDTFILTLTMGPEAPWAFIHGNFMGCLRQLCQRKMQYFKNTRVLINTMVGKRGRKIVSAQGYTKLT